MREAGAAQAVAPDEAAPPAAKSRSGARSGAGLHRTGLKEAELNRIIHLKKNLDYSDALIQYAGKYRKIGWDLVAVNFRGEPVFDLDFHEAETVWGPRLADWGLEGQQVNLGVRTGAPSRLLVLEVHREESRAPFNQRGDWCSGCVAEVGMEREQHYYTLPKGWQPPASFFLESFQIMVFGEGGLILVPPSLDPRLQTNLRWLRPPWESPPTRPSQALCRFITENAPRFAAPQVKPLPEIMAWNKIYPAIQPHPRLLQALLAPAASPAAYYRTLLGEAQAAGLGDAALLLGLLWHAPLGEAREPWDKLAHLEEVVKQHLSGSEEAPTEMAEGTESEAPGIAQPPGLPRPQTGSPAALSVAPPSSASPGSVGPEGNGASTFGSGGCSPGWQEIFRLSQENLVVERRRYEAMIYELGKLGALQEFLRKENRQNKALRDKLEGQWDAELKYLRQQLTTKKPKKGWYRSWWQE
jgi:hypothetical protein